jgi:endonuclease III
MTAVAKAARKPAPRPAAKAAAPKKSAAKPPKAAPAPKAPPPPKRGPRFRGGPKQRLAALLPKFDALFGSIQPPEGGTVLEKALYLVLREGGGDASATRGLQSLREGFIDWNEVRASRPTELALLMSAGGRTQKRLLETSRRVKDLIDQVYGDRNEPSLEFLLEQKTKERLEYLEDLDDLGAHNAYALAQWLSGDDKLVAVSPNMAKAAHRLGLVDSAAVTKVRTSLSTLAHDVPSLIVLQAHLTQLGEMEETQWPSSLEEFLP